MRTDDTVLYTMIELPYQHEICSSRTSTHVPIQSKRIRLVHMFAYMYHFELSTLHIIQFMGVETDRMTTVNCIVPSSLSLVPIY